MNTSVLECPVCNEGALTPERYSQEIQYNEATILVEGLEGCRCAKCGAEPVLTDQIRRNQIRFCDARRRSDGLLAGAEIRAIRERFGLSQTDAALMFGGGPNAFSKYERGEVVQSVPMDRLLRSADTFPTLVGYLRAVAGLGGSEFPTGPSILREAWEISLNDPKYTSKPVSGPSVHVSHQNQDKKVIRLSDWLAGKRAA